MDHLDLTLVRSACVSSANEASCAAAVRTAKNMVADVGQQAASASGGLVRFAQTAVGNEERSVHTQFKKHSLDMPIPLTPVPNSRDQRGKPFHALRLRDWIQHLAERNCLHILAGLARADLDRERAIWRSFWEKFRESNSDHEIFSLERKGLLKLEDTIGIIYHGDEGRGRRKQQFFVSQFHSCLGRGLRPAKREQTKVSAHRPYLKQKLNYIGHVHTNRFLCGVLPKHLYFKDDINVDALFSFAAAEADYMCRHGVEVEKRGRVHACLIGIHGDWPFLAKVGRLERNFACLPKRIPPTKGPQPVWCRGIYHLCSAGQAPYPFEQIGSQSPRWLDSIGEESPFWKLPEFAGVPHVDGQLERLFQYDIWHSFHLGVGKHFLGSALALASAYFPGGTVDIRFSNLTAAFRGWCKENGEVPYLTNINKESISWITTSDFPKGIWSKGSATTVLFKWFESWSSNVQSDDPVFLKTRVAAQVANKCMKKLYSVDDFWLPSSMAAEIGTLGVEFLRLYHQLACMCHSEGRCLYIHMPKAHILQHIFLVDLLKGSRSKRYIIHPLAWGTQLDEDFIGKSSRVSRRTHASTVIQRVLMRYLLSAKQEFVRAGYLIS